MAVPNFPEGLLAYTELYSNGVNYVNYDDDGHVKECQITYGDASGNAYIHAKAQPSHAPDTFLEYFIHITEATNNALFVAYGTVEINKNTGEFYVQGVKDAPLHDKYDDCFVITPKDYRHILGY